MKFFETDPHDIQCYVDIYDPIQVDNPVFILFWMSIYAGLILIFNLCIVRRQHVKIQFFITDFWAAIIALTPAFLLLTDLQNNIIHEIPWRILGLFVLTFFSTLCGIWFLLVLSQPKRGDPLPRRWPHAVAVMGGGFAGLVGVFFTGLVFELLPSAYIFLKLTPYIIYYWLALCYLMPPLMLVTLVFLYLFKTTYDLLV